MISANVLFQHVRASASCQRVSSFAVVNLATSSFSSSATSTTSSSSSSNSSSSSSSSRHGLCVGAGRKVEAFTRFKFQKGNTPGYGLSKHRSNRAKLGLYHGKDIQFGHSISHSHTKTKRRWYPNVVNKRVFSQSLNDWVRFKMTTKAMKVIDDVGGIDNYLLSLEDKEVALSNYTTKIRRLITSKLYHDNMLGDKLIKRLGYDIQPPVTVSSSDSSSDSSEDKKKYKRKPNKFRLKTEKFNKLNSLLKV